MKAEVISIGTEVITGSILNTNTRYLSRKLLECGIETYYHTSVEDNKDRIKEVFNIAIERSDLIITTGGLGPTEDDMTKEVVADILGLKLIQNRETMINIKNIFQSLNKDMTLNNEKQALIPEGSKIITNDIGTAPGIYIEKNSKKIILLPGPPKEIESMFDKYIIPIIKEDFSIITRSIKTIGIGESALEIKIKDIIDREKELIIATYASSDEVEIKIIAKGKDEHSLNKKIDTIIKQILSRVGDNVYSLNGETIEESILKMLKNKNYKIGFCESCTGGLITSQFTRIPGVSEVLDRSIVTYSNDSKQNELGVKKSTLDKFGAVSKEVALEMADGLLKKANLDIAVSTTGIAGPSSDSSGNPVGLVFIAIVTKSEKTVFKYNLSGDRVSIQNKVAVKAFEQLRRFLLK